MLQNFFGTVYMDKVSIYLFAMLKLKEVSEVKKIKQYRKILL